jgi:hypothetical protein
MPNLSAAFNIKGDLHELYFQVLAEYIESKQENKYFNLIKGFYQIGASHDQFQEVWEYLTEAFENFDQYGNFSKDQKQAIIVKNALKYYETTYRNEVFINASSNSMSIGNSIQPLVYEAEC